MRCVRTRATRHREFLTLLDELRQAAREMPADDLLWHIYDRCHVMAIFGAMEDGAMRQARLTALYDYARQLVQSGKAGIVRLYQPSAAAAGKRRRADAGGRPGRRRACRS